MNEFFGNEFRNLAERQGRYPGHEKKQGGHGPAQGGAEMVLDCSLGVDWPRVIVADDYGNETEYETMMTFDSEATGKSYIVYTDYSMDENDRLQLYASAYDPEKAGHSRLQLIPLSDERDFETVEEALAMAQREVLKNPERYLKELL